MWVGSVFTGIGGFDLAFERAGARVAWQVEIDRVCGRVLARHWPTVPRYGDVAEVTGERLRAELGGRADVDVLVGGFPCTDLSVAGRRAGLAGAASGLFWEFHRLAGELRPRWLVIENVDGLLSSNGGRDMGTVVGALAELGYGYAWRCLDARHFGLAQRRRRLFIVGCLGEPWRASPEVLFEPESCGGDPPPVGGAGSVDTGDVEGGARGDGGAAAQRELMTAPGQRRSRKRDVEETTNTLTASMLGGVGPELKQAEAGFLVAVHQQAFNIDPLTGQAIHVGARETQVAQALTAVGNAKQSWRGTFVADIPLDLRNATRSDGSTGVGTPGAGIGEPGDPALTSTVPAAAAVYEPANVDVYRKSRRCHSDDDYETWEADRLANTLNTFEGHNAVRTTHAVVASDWSVRRLTPLECCRLQGYPDGWTQTDVTGRAVSDTAQYRQLGNAVAVPVVEWIANRLVAVNERIEGEK